MASPLPGPGAGGAPRPGPVAPPRPDPSAVREAVVQRPDDVARVLVELTYAVEGPEDLQLLLQRTADLAAEVVQGVDSAGVTVLVDGRPATAACTDERTLAVDQGQYDADEGPCLDAARQGRLENVDVDEARQRYPRFARDAEALGIRSFLAAPLVGGGRSLGALNLYSSRRAAFDGLDEALLLVLTGHAGGAVAHYLRYADAQTLAGQLEEAMRSRSTIEQAKGVVMAFAGGDAESAFATLRRASQNANVKLRDLAGQVVTAAREPEARDAVHALLGLARGEETSDGGAAVRRA